MDRGEPKPSKSVSKSIRTPNGIQMIYANKLYCTYCPTDFHSVSARKTHERCHEGRKSSHCDDCHASFHRKNHLQRHKKVCSLITQLGENIKWCDFCDNFFKKDQTLKNHYFKAHGILYDPASTQKYKKSKRFVPLVCDLCGSSFPNNFRLGNHKYIRHKINKNTENGEKSSKNTIRIQNASSSSIIVECSETEYESTDSDVLII